MRMPFLAVIPLLALAGCGAKPTPAATDGNSTAIAIAPDEPQAPSGEASGITAIDAATGDARAMPADSTAPSAYDLAQRAERAEEAEARREARAAPAAEPGAPVAPSAGDEAVAAGD